MKLLFVDCCVSQRGPDSRTRALAEAFLAAFREGRPEAEIETVDLQSLELRPFLPEALNERDALARAGDFDGPLFRLARQFRDADRIVVAAPYWDLSFPSLLRLYIEHVAANGVCYHYEADGCRGDCRAAHLVYLSSGGDFEGPENLGVLYWKQLAAMFGIPRYDYVFAGGLDADPDRAPELLDAAREQARRLGLSL